MVSPTLQFKKATSGTFVLCMLLSVVAVLFLVMPKYRDYSTKKLDHMQAADSLTQLQSQQNDLQKLYSEVASNKADLAKMDLAVPPKPDIAGLYALMESFGKSANLTLTSIQAVDVANIPDNQKTPDQLNSISSTLGTVIVNMQLSGSVAGFNQMLAEIEQGLRLIDVQSVDISQEKDATSLTFRVTLKTYYQK